MIHFFAVYNRTIKDFTNWWAPELASALQPANYRNLLWSRPRSPAAVIFSDMEQLPEWQLVLAKKFCRNLQNSPNPPKILNDPNHYAGRFELLEILHRHGINDFRASRLDRVNELKFPVFLRRDLDHRGPVTGLLHSPDEVAQAVKKLSLRDRCFRRHRLMAVEYLDCRDSDGLFRKYSVMKIGGTLIPRHILLSREWVTKKADFVDEATVAEETAFIENFPHREKVAEIFRVAGVDYGRVDYGVKNGRLQVWEINTNPTIVPAPLMINPLRKPLQRASAAFIARTLASLNAKQ